MRTRKEIEESFSTLSMPDINRELLLDIRQILANLLLTARPFSGFNVEGDIITECAKIAGEKKNADNT